MKRGRNLERQVIKVMEEKMNIRITTCEMFILPDFILFGASPDGLSEKYVVEVKYPSSIKSRQQYRKNGLITDKFKAQLMPTNGMC